MASAAVGGAAELFRFLLSFYGERLFTLGVEELIILVFITLLRFPRMPVKFVATFITITLNSLISKFIVFRKRQVAESGQEEEKESFEIKND